MKVNIQSIHFDADSKLLNFIEGKLQKLTGLSDRIIESEVTLRLDKAANNHNKIAEIRVHLPGTDLYAKRQCKSFEEATDQTLEALRNQLVKHKGKTNHVH